MKQKLSHLLVETLRHMATYIRNHYGSSKKVLREKQMNVFEAVYAFFKEKKTSGYVKLPTGTGKTVLFGQIIRAVANGNSRALIIVPRIQLVQQTYESLKHFAPELSVGRINMYHKEYGDKITILTYTSWQIQLESGELSLDDFDYIILDEGHRALTPKIQPYVEAAKEKSIVIGFSATPGFSVEKHLSELLEHEIYTMELAEAIRLGLLSGVRVMLVDMDIDLSNTASLRGDYDVKDLEKLINTSKVNHTALEVYQRHFNGECAIIYANSIQHVSDVVATFSAAGIEARGIYGTIPKKERDQILNDYNAGIFNVLVNCDLLIEGFDEPRVSVCMNLRPTQSVVLAEQRGGRVLRLDPENPGKVASVVDFIYKESTRRKIAILFSQITGGALVLPELFHTSTNLEGGEIRNARELIEIDGVKIIYDVHTIDVLTKERMEHNNKLDLGKLTWEELKAEVQRLNIRSSLEYHRVHHKHPRWPYAPRYYGKSWPDLFDFRYLKLTDLKKKLADLGIEKQKEYMAERKKGNHMDWPSIPPDFYPELKNWGELFGREKPTYLELPELKKEVRKKKLKSVDEYRKEQQNHANWPAVPDRHYKQYGNTWISWPDLFGKIDGKTVQTIKELKKEVRAAGITSRAEYFRQRKPNWPSDPKGYYDDWVSFEDLLNTKKPEWITSLAQLKKEVRALGLMTAKAYHRARKTRPQWHSQPEKFFPDWTSWEDFVGKKSARAHQFLLWAALQKEVRGLGIKTSTEYFKVRKDHPKWPSQPDMFYSEKWKSWPDFLGTNG